MFTKALNAVRCIHKLRGGSQPLLIQGSDRLLYVVKFSANPQGTSVAFNEAMGLSLFTAAGLPSPAWRVMMLSEEFISRNPACWFNTPDGPQRPQPGPCLATRYLSVPDAQVLEILPSSSFNRVANRLDFWRAWVLDIFAEHADHRQALFLPNADRQLHASFIDHGHMFGGASNADRPRFVAARYLDRRIYGALTAEQRTALLQLPEQIDHRQLQQAFESLPLAWKTPEATRAFRRFLTRLSDANLLSEIDHLLRQSETEVPLMPQRLPLYATAQQAVLCA